MAIAVGYGYSGGLWLQRVITLLLGKVHVAERDALTPAHAEAYRRQCNAVSLHVIDAKPADEVQAPFDARKPLVERCGVRQVVHQYECLDRIRAHVESDGRALPVHLVRRNALEDEFAAAI